MPASIGNQALACELRFEEVPMARYLFQLTYTPQAWAALLKNPHNRTEVVKPLLQKLGGELEIAYFAFGDHDLVGVLNMPSNVEAAAFSLAVTAGGAIKAVKTTPLMTLDEGISAMSKAAAAATSYAPPGAAAGV
jgi:uncharacterized protein with GYD domain